MRRTMLVLCGLLLTCDSAAAQDRAVLFLHGYRSSRALWEDTANRLQNDLQLQATRRDTPSTDPYEAQASNLQGQTYALPSNTVAVGHSNGGIVARQLSRLRPLSAIISLGTPHQGTGLAVNGPWLVPYFTAVAAQGGAFAWEAYYRHGYHPWFEAVYDLTEGYFAQGIGLITGLFGYNANPVLGQMGPVSPFRSALNDSVTQEPPVRISLAFDAPRRNEGGFALGLFPDGRNVFYNAKQSTIVFLGVLGAYFQNTYPYGSPDWWLGFQAEQLSALVAQADSRWCFAVTNDSTCSIPYDGIVPQSSQRYPGPSLNWDLVGTHTTEVRESADELYYLLTTFTSIPPRTAGGAGGGTGGGGTGGGAGGGGCQSSLSAGQSLAPGEALCSPNGEFTLTLQGDGNLVLYGPGGAGWATNTFWSPQSLEMQGDGNLVLYDTSGQWRWASGTVGNNGAVLEVQNDGNIVVYRSNGTVAWWAP